jgi:signal transduction histidine kinase
MIGQAGIVLEAQSDLIPWADVWSKRPGYGRSVPIVRSMSREWRTHRWDYAISGLMVVIAIIVFATRIDVGKLETHQPADAVVGWTATIGICLTLIGRRRWPLRCLAIAIALLFVLGVTDNSDSVGYLALLIGLYSAAAELPRRRAVAAVAMVLLLAVVGVIFMGADPSTGLVGAGAAFVLGRLVRRRRGHQDDRATEAKQRSVVDLEVAELDAATDRQRMAQELHDVLAHSLSVIAVQAGIGAHLIDREPAEAALALDAIRVTSDAANGELSRLVELLRDGDSAVNEPAPALTDVRSLCAQVAEAGVPIELVAEGDLSAVPSGVSLAAYRIVQEALTNVVRYAGPVATSVLVRASSGNVEILVEDDGRGVAAPPEPQRTGGGHGLVGMKERAQLYGGDAVAGPRAEGGFRVHAMLRSVAGVDPAEGATDPVALHRDEPVARSRRRVSPLAWDVALALAFAGFGVVELLTGRSADAGAGFTPADGWAWFLKIGCCLMLAGRRRYPAASLLASTVLAVALTIGDYETGVVVAVFVVGLYAVGGYATTARLVAALVGIGVAMSIVAWSHPPDLSAAGAVWTAMIATAAAVAGLVVRRDHERRDAKIAEQEQAGAAESRRARLAVTTERLRIAEELDRVITRAIDSIFIRAGSGSQIVQSDPAAAHELLEAISTTSRDALADLRRLLKRMRTEDEPTRYAPSTTTVDPITTAARIR